MRISIPLLAALVLFGCDSGASPTPPDLTGRWVTAAQAPEGQGPLLDLYLSFIGDGATGIVVGTGTTAGGTQLRADGWYTEREFKVDLSRADRRSFDATVLVDRSTCGAGADCRATITGTIELQDAPFSRAAAGPDA